MSSASKTMDLMEQLAAFDVRVTEITINVETAARLAMECGWPGRAPWVGLLSFNGAKVVVTKPKRTEKQQLIEQLRACADQLEKSE